jgi:POT family proton-dependent oligopeptide transporter
LTQYRPNVWLQAPLYVLLAIGEVFAMTTAMEYAEKHAPKQMEVLVQAIGMLITGVGSAIALVIAEAARDPYLTWFYASLTIGMAVTAIIFWCVFRKCDQDEPPSSHNTATDPEKGSDRASGTTTPTDSARGFHGSNLSVTTKDIMEDIELPPIPSLRTTVTNQRDRSAVL